MKRSSESIFYEVCTGCEVGKTRVVGHVMTSQGGSGSVAGSMEV